uniref:RNA-dependent RNA polymerase n=1 Tax=Cinnamomum chago deltapartitivirus 1 TaxID=2765856 RepID=A0A8D9PH42_9VIRU|nr:TPA_exp: RNA-dependent RNA polymerase [Cinnamomum chago deltapartitivirus 1]
MLRNIREYEFLEFTNELEDLGQYHIHQVRREPGVTYRDEFALRELNDLYPRLYEQWLQGWSRSFYTGEDHMKAILQYAHPNTPIERLDDRIYQLAMSNVLERLSSLPSVRAFDVKSQLDLIHYEPSSAAGYDYIGAKGPILDANHERAIRRAKAVLWSAIAPDGEGMDHVIRTSVPDVGYTRTQLTDLGEKTKVRGVWGRAFHYILLEGTAANPLLEAFKQGGTFFHIGQDPRVSVPMVLSEISRNCQWLLALDWKSFDATISRFEIHAAFDILKQKVDFPNYETEQCFEICRQLFIHKKIAAPDSKIYWSHKGLPSGSYYTSIIGSIVNRLRIEYIWLTMKGRSPQMCYTQGDDSIIGEDQFIDPVELAKVAEPLGWLINPAKTETSRLPEYVTFLGRTSYGGLNQRDLKRCIRLLIFPEYPVESGSISAFRAASIAQDAGNTSRVLNDVAKRLRRHYGMASPEDVPKQFRLYIP